MSLELAQSHGITAKTGLPCTCHGRGMVNLYRPAYSATKEHPAFDACITMEDFVCLVQYVLTNTELQGKNDPRALFVKYARTLAVKKIHKDGLRVVSKRAAKKK